MLPPIRQIIEDLQKLERDYTSAAPISAGSIGHSAKFGGIPHQPLTYRKNYELITHLKNEIYSFLVGLLPTEVKILELIDNKRLDLPLAEAISEDRKKQDLPGAMERREEDVQAWHEKAEEAYLEALQEGEPREEAGAIKFAVWHKEMNTYILDKQALDNLYEKLGVEGRQPDLSGINAESADIKTVMQSFERAYINLRPLAWPPADADKMLLQGEINELEEYLSTLTTAKQLVYDLSINCLKPENIGATIAICEEMEKFFAINLLKMNGPTKELYPITEAIKPLLDSFKKESRQQEASRGETIDVLAIFKNFIKHLDRYARAKLLSVNQQFFLGLPREQAMSAAEQYNPDTARHKNRPD